MDAPNRPSPRPEPPGRGALAAALLPALALGVALFHLLTARGYGIFRDELYYLSCARRLAWGYVDHPPLAPALLALQRAALGDSLAALRFLPAVAAGVTSLLAGLLARAWGGRLFAQALAALACALAPVALGLFSIYSMNAFDLVFWTACCLLVAKLLRGGDRRLWLVWGLLVGLGLQNKLSMLFLAGGTGVGLLLTGQREQLRGRWFWYGCALAAALTAPFVAWQIAHGWPTREFMANAMRYKNAPLSPPAFLREQLLNMNPCAAPLWLGGLLLLLRDGGRRGARALGIAWLAILAVMLATRSKPYYLAPAYAPLWAAGAVGVQRLGSRRGWRWLAPVALSILVVSAASLAPLAKPLLPEAAFVSYARAIGVTPHVGERHEQGRLPQFFADMHGWPELARQVSDVFHALPAADQARACLLAGNYGEAGALEFYGAALGLPPVICGHNNWWLWGPGACQGEVLIAIGWDREELAGEFASLEAGGVVSCDDCMPYENGLTIWVCRGARRPPAQVWALLRDFN